MRACEVLWDVDRADQMEALVESSTGQPCPCRAGGLCPFVPAAVVLPTPRPRGDD